MARLGLKTLGASYKDALRITNRKSVWMVLWLRARRTGDMLRGFYRREHFSAKHDHAMEASDAE